MIAGRGQQLWPDGMPLSPGRPAVSKRARYLWSCLTREGEGMTGSQGSARRDGTAADTAYWYKLTTHCLVESPAGGRVKSVRSEPVTVHGGSIHSGEGRSIESGWLKVWRSADSESFLDVYSRPGNHFLLPSTRSLMFGKGGMDLIYYYVLI